MAFWGRGEVEADQGVARKMEGMEGMEGIIATRRVRARIKGVRGKPKGSPHA